MASSELERKLRRRSEIIERAEAEAAADETAALPASERPSSAWSDSTKVTTLQLANNPYNEFRELSRKQIQTCQKMFNRFATLCGYCYEENELDFIMPILATEDVGVLSDRASVCRSHFPKAKRGALGIWLGL